MKIKVGPVTVKMLDGDRIHAALQDGRKFEPDSLEAWAEFAAVGKTMLDVGAYTGIYAISAALMGCKTIAIEPMPKIVERLRDNAKLNGVVLDIHEMAASDSDGTAYIQYNPKLEFSSNAGFSRGKGEQKVVRIGRVDALGLQDVVAIKIDVERHEPAVLRGAMETIRRCRPALLVEILDGDMKPEIAKLLPDYREVAQLDIRNFLFQ